MYKIVITGHFKNQLKPLLKRNRLLRDDLRDCLVGFDKSRAVAIGKGVYKVRIKGFDGGKSGGYRMYVFLMELRGILVPVSIYGKGERENLPVVELTAHLKAVKKEIELWL